MRWVERVAAIHLARDHDPDGRLIGLQGTDLDGGGVGAQHDSVADIERILGIERRVVVGEVEGVEVVALRLRLGADRAREAKLVEDLADLVYDLGDKVRAAGPGGAAGHGEILALGGARGALQRALARRQRGFELALQGVGRPSDGLALLRLEGGERAQDTGERASFPAQDLGLELLEPAFVRLRNLGESLPQRVQGCQEVAHGQSAFLASFITFFLRFKRATLLLTRGMTGLLRLQQALQAHLVGASHQRRLAQVPLPLGVLLRQDVTLVRPMAAQPARPGQPHALPERTLGLEFRHCGNPWFRHRTSELRTLTSDVRGLRSYFGASTIDMFRPSSLGSCSTLLMSFNCSATRSSTPRPSSIWAICRPRYIIVTFTLLPSSRNSRACRVLNAKS